MAKTHIVIRIRGGDPTPAFLARRRRPPGVPEDDATYKDDDTFLDALKARVKAFDVRFIAFNAGLANTTGSQDPIPGVIAQYKALCASFNTKPPASPNRPSGTLSLWGYSLGGRNVGQLAAQMKTDLGVVSDLVVLADPAFEGRQKVNDPDQIFPTEHLRNYYQDILYQRVPWATVGDPFSGPMTKVAGMTAMENIDVSLTNARFSDYIANHNLQITQKDYLALSASARADYDKRYGEAVSELHKAGVQEGEPKCVDDIVALISANN